MAIQEIVKTKHPTLRIKSKPVQSITPEIETLVTDLIDTLESVKHLGVGLSANQIDQTHRIFVAKIADNQEDVTNTPPTVFINPEIIHTSDETTLSADPEKKYLEGCLSLPNIWGFVERPLHATFRFHTLNTLKENKDPIEITFSDFNAVVTQHELDHLDGVLFTDRAFEQNQKMYEIRDGEEPRVITL